MPLKAIERNILDIRIEDIPLFIQNIFYSNSLYSASVQHHGQFHNNNASGHILTKIFRKRHKGFIALGILRKTPIPF